MQLRWVVVVVLAAACSSKDDCERFFDKSNKLLERMMTDAGKSLDAKTKQGFLDDCRKSLKEGKKDPIMPCVLDAKDDAAVATCWQKAFGEYRDTGKVVEAKIQLKKIEKSAKVAFITNASFPKGAAATLPAKPCCPDKCEPADWSKDPVWTALDFQIDEGTRFQYHYESDGQTFTATAIGDLDCDGVAITYKLTGKTVDGNPETSLEQPPANID
jgi:hypothetical protein